MKPSFVPATKDGKDRLVLGRDETPAERDEPRSFDRNRFAGVPVGRIGREQGGPEVCKEMRMRAKLVTWTAVAAAMMPAPAMADDPNDPTMRSAAARARDRAIIRQLNRQELARVRKRDARYAQVESANRARSRDHERAMADYARSRARHEQELAEWRHAVAQCRQGNVSACDN